jgi:hypothetical protein
MEEVEGRRGKTHLDNARPDLALVEEALVQSEHLSDPVHHNRLKLSAGGRAEPVEARVRDGAGVNIAENGFVGGVGGEVGEEGRVLPMGDTVEDAASEETTWSGRGTASCRERKKVDEPWKDYTVKILRDGSPLLSLLRCVGCGGGGRQMAQRKNRDENVRATSLAMSPG